MTELLAALLIVVLLVGCVISIVRDPDDDEPATLESGKEY
jgi:hypothetical protein